jgi:tRNA threonylcarbamoyladenosine modification (KEOPS) complex  Pcc1 subunit
MSRSSKKHDPLTEKSETEPMVLRCQLSVKIPGDKRTLSALRDALDLETIVKDRSSLSVRQGRDGNTLLLEFSSKDLVSLRASMNTNLRLVASALNTIDATRSLVPASQTQKD